MSYHMLVNITVHWKKCDTGHIDVVSAEYESSYVCQELSSVKMISHIACIDMVSPQYEPSYVC